MHRLPMRTILSIALLALSFGLTAISLLIIRSTVGEQIHANLEQDLRHSVKTYVNLERQRGEMLAREAALLADLPSLKSLMTTEDRKTIADAGVEFWKVSGSDFMALADPEGRLVTYYARGPAPASDAVRSVLALCIDQPLQPRAAAVGDRLYEVVAQPIYFGPQAEGTVLGYVAIGYAIDEQVAREVSEAAAAEVAFAVEGQIVVSTLGAPLERSLRARGQVPAGQPGATQGQDIRLGKEEYLAASVPLTPSSGEAARPAIALIVLKSYNQAGVFLTRVNRWVLGVGALSLVLGWVLAGSIARRVTRPLEALVEGSRALGRGDYERRLSDGGTSEIQELSRAFEGMRRELRRSQQELLESERLATIGRMARSISHDLRHYLSAMYANAEFLSLARTSQQEREELIGEVRGAVHGMTELLDSLLIFSQTGSPLHPSYESIDLLVEGAVSLVRAHPEARGVRIVLELSGRVDGWVDARKLSRAVFNLALNACQAAKCGIRPPLVTITLEEDEEQIALRIADNGAGVVESIRETMFLPFVSSGKANGVGLGLTLARHIAQEHGGGVSLDASCVDGAVFSITLPKAALETLRTKSEEEAHRV